MSTRSQDLDLTHASPADISDLLTTNPTFVPTGSDDEDASSEAQRRATNLYLRRTLQRNILAQRKAAKAAAAAAERAELEAAAAERAELIENIKFYGLITVAVLAVLAAAFVGLYFFGPAVFAATVNSIAATIATAVSSAFASVSAFVAPYLATAGAAISSAFASVSAFVAPYLATASATVSSALSTAASFVVNGLAGLGLKALGLFGFTATNTITPAVIGGGLLATAGAAVTGLGYGAYTLYNNYAGAVAQFVGNKVEEAKEFAAGLPLIGRFIADERTAEAVDFLSDVFGVEPYSAVAPAAHAPLATDGGIMGYARDVLVQVPYVGHFFAPAAAPQDQAAPAEETPPPSPTASARGANLVHNKH